MPIIIGGKHITGDEHNVPVLAKRTESVHASLQDVRRKAMNLPLEVPSKPSATQTAASPRKTKEVSDVLIQYRESSFMSDMLQTDKD